MKYDSPNENKILLVLHNIRSAYNVGSIFRTADAAGVSKIYLIGVTPAPIDNFGRTRRDIAKTALGAELTIPWEHSARIDSLIKKLKKARVFVIAVEQSPKSTDYREIKGTKNPLAFVFGNEVCGLSPNTLSSCDTVVEIPMHGSKESLNVSVAAGIILFSQQ